MILDTNSELNFSVSGMYSNTPTTKQFQRRKENSRNPGTRKSSRSIHSRSRGPSQKYTFSDVIADNYIHGNTRSRTIRENTRTEESRVFSNTSRSFVRPASSLFPSGQRPAPEGRVAPGA